MNQSSYYPESWVAFKVVQASDEVIYKIFASWAGGYISSDSWRINSGVTDIKQVNNDLHIRGYSGSVYNCNKESYGYLTGYNHSVLKRFMDRIESETEATVHVFNDVDEFLADFESNVEKTIT